MKRHAGTAGAVTATALVMALSAASWACTAFTSLTGPKAGLAESEVTVEGESLVRERDADQLVELRWNGIEGPLLAEVVTDSVGSLAAAVTIPQVAPGIYFIVAVTEDKGVARMSFEVTAPAEGTGDVGDPRPATLVGADQAAQRPNTFPAAGTALLGGGLVALAAASGVMVVRTRRKAVTVIDGHTDGA